MTICAETREVPCPRYGASRSALALAFAAFGLTALPLLGQVPALPVVDCIPPEAPLAADPDLAAKYRQEIVADYQRYWLEAPRYIACLDAARAKAMRDLEASVDEYDALFPQTSVPSEGDQSQ